jgi:uncharacterized protein YdcH (DUF465 family)
MRGAQELAARCYPRCYPVLRADEARYSVMFDEHHDVDRWIKLLQGTDLDDQDRLEEILSLIPAHLLYWVGELGGPGVRERIYAPIFAEWKRDGRIEWTGEFTANGQKIWRKV